MARKPVTKTTYQKRQFWDSVLRRPSAAGFSHRLRPSLRRHWGRAQASACYACFPSKAGFGPPGWKTLTAWKAGFAGDYFLVEMHRSSIRSNCRASPCSRARRCAWLRFRSQATEFDRIGRFGAILTYRDEGHRPSPVGEKVRSASGADRTRGKSYSRRDRARMSPLSLSGVQR